MPSNRNRPRMGWEGRLHRYPYPSVSRLAIYTDRHLTKVYYIISPSARIDKTINMSLGFSVYPKGNTKSGRIAFNETVDKDKPSISRCIGKIHPTVQATPGIIFYYSSRFSGSQLAILQWCQCRRTPGNCSGIVYLYAY